MSGMQSIKPLGKPDMEPSRRSEMSYDRGCGVIDCDRSLVATILALS